MEKTASEQERTEGGVIHIAPEVIEVISGLAALEVEGVAGMIGGFASGVSELLGRKNVAKGVKVQLQDQEAKVDVSISIQYGRSIPFVAQNIQYRVKQAIESMTGLTVREVNIHVLDVQLAVVKSEEESPENVRPNLMM